MKINEGKYTAILVDVRVRYGENWNGLQRILDWTLMIDRGVYAKECLQTTFYFQEPLLDVAKGKFNEWGGVLNTYETIEDDIKTIIGSKFFIGVKYGESGKQLIRIFDYLGKYIGEK